MTLPRGHFTGRAFRDWREFGLPQRLGVLAVLFALELIAVSTWIDTRAFGGSGRPAFQAVVAFAALFLTFSYLRSKLALQRISNELVGTSIKWGLLVGHFGAMAAFAALSSFLLAEEKWGLHGNLLSKSPLLAGLLAIGLGAAAFVPPRVWLDLLRSTGTAWVYAAGATFVALQLISRFAPLWQPATGLTFVMVRALLRPLLPDLVADPTTNEIGSREFMTTISASCSGVEGVGLILVFSVAWLWFFRRECRFPQAFLLIPAGVCVLWLLNVLRIAVLILIGNAGAASVAVGGFHSQAGWIAFNAVALGFSLTAQRVQWFTVRPRARRPEESSAENPTAAYLTPFLAILAAAMLARAASGTFEWLYPLRFFAAAGTLWFLWPKYAKLDWNFGWVAPIVGSLVFVIWLGLDLVSGAHKDSGLASDLAVLPASGRFAWLAFRTLAAVVTVPIAEELAFRGFLLRRLISADFESVSMRTVTVLSILVSSVAFGLLHGDRWLAGAAAGMLYAGALLWRGRIGDAVVAHGVTNALIAACVLFGGKWYLW
ncbi:MAG: exosortase E/protease, VPEID-CTERM system [Acidobacteriia bacterium]|nr:exosortase E/protease, VPEID-CTERM system [Terriglobia bacterium]